MTVPATQDLKSEDGIERVADAASTERNNAAQKSVPPERAFSSSKYPSHGPNEQLVEAVDADNHRHLPQNTACKQSFLHPSMWMWEVVSVVFAALIFVVIVTVLAVYDRKPSPVFGGVSLNTAVAFAATLFELSLMGSVTSCMSQLTWVSLHKGYKPLVNIIKFDAASRGPLGSLQLLFEFKRFNPIVYIAAIVIVISIITDSFFQQSVHFYYENLPEDFSNDPSWSAFASTAFTYSGSAGNVGVNEWLYGKDVPSNLKAAAYSGLYSAGMTSLPHPPYSCPSGSCSWDPFPTLGVSAQCFNETAVYSLNCSEKVSGFWSGHPFRPCTITAVGTRTSALSTQYPPVSDDLTSSMIVFESNASYIPWSPFKWFGSNYSIDNGLPKSWQDNSTSLQAGFALFEWKLARNLFYFPQNLSTPAVVTSESTIEAGYCIFYIDMQILSAYVADGVYGEYVINKTTQIQGTPDFSTMVEGNFTYTYHPQCQNSGAPANCNPKPINITFPQSRYQTITASLRDVLPSANATTGMLANIIGKGQTNPGAAEYLYRTPNITETMRTIAHYMTVALRVNDTLLEQQNATANGTTLPADYVAPNHRVVGTVYVQTVLLRVRWGFLAFPAALILIATILLFETIRISRPEAVGIWKGYLLAALLNTQWRPELEMMGSRTIKDTEEVTEELEARVIGREGLTGATRSVAIRKRERPMK